MHRILKRLRGLFLGKGGTTVDVISEARNLRLIGAKGHEIVFISDQMEVPDTGFVMKVSIKHERVRVPELATVRVTIQSVRPLAKGTECTGQLIDPPDNVVYLLERQFHEVNPAEEKKKRIPAGGHELRQAERQDRTFQVMSPHFRRFKAIALDISATGLRVQGEDFVDKGDVIKLCMDFDLHRMPVVEVEAEVMWCRAAPDEDEQWVLGLRFLDPPPKARSLIDRYLGYLHQVEKDWMEGRFPVR